MVIDRRYHYALVSGLVYQGAERKSVGVFVLMAKDAVSEKRRIYAEIRPCVVQGPQPTASGQETFKDHA
jgi:hypothetical protein